MNAVRLLSLGLFIFVVGCAQQTTPTATETRPAVRAANGTLYDLNCLKGKKPNAMGQCAVSASSAKKAWGSAETATLNSTNYFVWQISYFDEMAMCQWLFGIDACYNYFGVSYVPGPRCDIGWLYQYQDLPSARNCGWYWNPWMPQYNPYPQWPSYPTQPAASCESIRAQRDWLVQNINYCNSDAQCGNVYTAGQWGDCNPPPVNNWLASPELDYWVDLYSSQCLATVGAPACIQTLCPAPRCVQGRCQASCTY